MTPTRDELLKLAKSSGFKVFGRRIVAADGGPSVTLISLQRFAALLSAHQAQAEPAELFGIYIERSDGTTEFRRAGQPFSPTPLSYRACGLYTAPPSSDQTWNEAIAAAESVRHVNREFDYESYLDSGNSGDIAQAAAEREGAAWQDAIRALARPSQAQDQDCETCEGKGHYDERFGGYAFSNPKAACPDCDGKGWHLTGESQAQEPSTPVPSITITLRQAEALVGFFGGHDTEVTVTEPLPQWGETQPGLFAYCTEYPDEGTQYLGETEVDDDLANHGRKAQPVSGAVDELPPQPETDPETILRVCHQHAGGYGQRQDERVTQFNDAELIKLGRSLAAISRAQQAPAPADGLMVDMGPPATSRDRWMYEQGRLAERDPRTHASAQQAPAVSDDQIEAVSKALRRAWQLGQTYWQQADHEFCSQHKKADETRRQFNQLVDETHSLLSQPAAAPVSEQTTQEPK